MRQTCSFRFRLVLVLFACGATSAVSAADQLPLKRIPVVRTAGQAKAKSTMPSATIVQAGFVSDLQDTVVDNCETVPPTRLPLTRLRANRHPSRGYIRRKCDSVVWWFGYIAGHGPAVWVRDDY